ncbi:MAG: tRNA pseudouridine(38-40) synthase TruA [Flavobacteriaceae bacterium]|nr:MAG: tRNA pseudouridine(38-40) synthase TruA [Flavobacteriaceae bacterium]
MRFFLELSFLGTHYKGWQIQPNAKSVQEEIESAMSLLLLEPIKIMGAGRTDTGVHAQKMYAHFDTNHPLPNNFKHRLNAFLPKDIAIKNILPVKEDAHARFHATSRTYKYFVHQEKFPFYDQTSSLIREPLDFLAMNRACEILFKHKDFTSFSRLHTDVKTNFCSIYSAKWFKLEDPTQSQPPRWVFEISADRFLRNMVRAIVGTLLLVGKGNLSLEGFEEIILKKNRNLAGASVAAKGLSLTHIQYPKDLFLDV